MEKKSYSQRKRETLDYRREYFKHNPGLLGSIYFCAYCRRPLYRDEVEVDHIMPLNNALGRNTRYNLVAACKDCNRAKSDKVDGRVVIGYLSKGTDTVVFSAQKLVVRAVHFVSNIIFLIIKLPFALVRYLFGMMPLPFKIAFAALVVAIFIGVIR